MRDGQARSLLLSELADRRRRPEPLLRAAGRFAADDAGIAAALAARADLPGDLRAALAADSRTPVRAAFVRRGDVDAAELTALLAGETRASVLTGLAEAYLETDPVVARLLGERFLAKPTITLAAALFSAAAAPHRPARTRRDSPVPAPPAPVLVAMFVTAGGASASAALKFDIAMVADWLGAGGDVPAAEALARRTDAPWGARLRLASCPHLSVAARLALLEGTRGLPGEVLDVVLRLLEAPDLQPQVVTAARAALEAAATRDAARTLPAPGVTDAYTHRQQLLAGYAAAPCAGCLPDGYPLPEWTPGPAATGPRPDVTRAEPGSVDAANAAASRRPAAAPADELTDDLAALDDHELARRLPSLPDGRLPGIAALTELRKSTVLGAALLERPEVGQDAAVALLLADWFAPAAEVLVRLAGLRRGQPAFALAAAGRATEAVLDAYGTAILAEPGDPDPALAGGRVLAAAVARAVAGDPLPGWSSWLTPEGHLAGGRTRALAAMAARGDVPDEVLLALPWPIVGAVADRDRAPYWEQPGAARMSRVVTAALVAELGADPARWETFAVLADGWTASAGDLLHVAAATAA